MKLVVQKINREFNNNNPSSKNIKGLVRRKSINFSWIFHSYRLTVVGLYLL